jgi:hypothetical protein
MFCRSCGEAIKKKAEICPECGVRNEQSTSQDTVASNSQNTERKSTGSVSQQSDPAPKNASHNPSEYSTSVSENWHYGVGVSVAAWIVGFATPEGSAIGGFLFLIGWILMPVSIYYDHQWVQSTRKWNPDRKLWIILSIIPLVNIIAGGAYLFQRYDNKKVSHPNYDVGSAELQEKEDSALDDLRKRYANDELSDEEFEQKVEQIIGTEDIETAKVHMRQENSADKSDHN